jgi:hypothetical protein
MIARTKESRPSLGTTALLTHFDGHLVRADGRRRALAGDDVRYGGLYDLIGISPDTTRIA